MTTTNSSPTISYEKRLTGGLGGMVYYHMRREVAGQRFGIDIAATAYEYENCREILALRLRRARGELRRIGELVAAFHEADLRQGRHGRRAAR